MAGLRLVETQLDDDAAHRALLRLRQALSRRLSARLSGAAASIEVLDEGSPVVDATTVATLGDALDAGRVRFRYQDRHGNPSIRIVEPHRQVNRAGRWYLVGFDVDACAWRVFRLDRITAVERLPGTFRRRPLPRGTVAAYLASDFGRDVATSR